MDTMKIIALVALGIFFLGAVMGVLFFVKNLRDRRNYNTEELPDFEGEAEEETLPDVEESSFASIGGEFTNSDESVSEIYGEIYGTDEKAGGLRRRTRRQ